MTDAAMRQWARQSSAPGLATPFPTGVLVAMLAGWYRTGRQDVRTLLTASLDRMAAARTSGPPQSAVVLAQQAPLFADAARAFNTPRWAREAVERCDASVKQLSVDPTLQTHQWAQAIRAWAITGAAFERPDLVEKATANARRIEDACEVGTAGEPRHSDDGPFSAHDHAALSWAWIDLYESTGNPYWLGRAAHWADVMLARFWDESPEGAFDNAPNAKTPSRRSEPPRVDGGPGHQAMATLALSRLACFLGREDLAARAHDLSARQRRLLEQQPLAHGWAALASDWNLERIAEVALFGGDDDPVLFEMRAVVAQSYHPFLLLAHVPTRHEVEARSRIPWLAGRGARNGAARAFLCEGGSCRIPARNPTALKGQLAGLGPSLSS